MFDLTQPKNKVNQEFATPEPRFFVNPSISQGPRIELSESKRKPIAPISTTRQEPISKPPTTWDKIKVGDIKGLAKDLGVGVSRGIGKGDAVRQNEEAARIMAQNPLMSKFGNDQLEGIQRQRDYLESSPNNVVTMIGEELTKLPLWMAGEGVAGLAGKGLSKLAPSLSSKVGKLPSFVKGGIKDATAYATTVAPVESFREGESFSEFLEREKMTPGVLLGGAAFRGVGAGASKGYAGVKDALKPIGVPPAPFGPPRPIRPIQRRTGLGPLKNNDIPLEQGLNLSSNIRRADIATDPLADVQRAYNGPNIDDIRAKDAVKYNIGTDKTPTPIKPIAPSERNIMQGDLQRLFNDLPNQGKYTFTTGEQRALNELQDGIRTAQDYIGHTDVLAGYPPGTTIQQAYADIASKTGVDLPELVSNWDRSQSLKKSLTPEELRIGRSAGVIPPLAPRKSWTNMVQQEVIEPPISPPKAKNPLQWTNREGIPTKPTPIRPIPQQQTIIDTLRSELGVGTPVKTPTRANAPLKPPTGEIPKAGSLKINPPLPREERVFWQSVSKELYSKGERPPITVELMKKDIIEGKIDISKLSNEEEIRRALGMDLQKFAQETNTALPRSPEPTRQIGEGPGNAETFRAKVDRNPAKKKSFSEMFKGVRTQFMDDLAPLEDLEKAVSGGKLASAEDSLYKQGRLFRGSPERAGELIRSNLEPVIKNIEKLGKTTDDLGDYALAVHARDVNAKGIQSGFTNEEIAATIQKHGTPEMEAARKELMKINNDLLDSLADAGIIEKSLVTVLREKHPNYMPLFRSFDDEKIEFASGLSKALANVTVPIERLKGSKKNVIDPIESMIKNAYRTVSSVDRNKVALQLGKLADKDANSTFIRRLPEGEERARLNTVYAMENGKKVYYEVQPDVYKAIMNLDKESSNILIRILQKPASLLRAGATLTPEFSLRNPARDIPAAFAVSKSGLNPVRDIPMALLDIVKSKRGKETLYNQFLKDNAGYGNIISMDRKIHQEVMRDILPQKASDTFINIVKLKPLLRVLRGIADVSESATKLGEYRAALRSGASRPEAAYRARDIMDFARAGASVREANKIISFLNANLQGKSKLYRAIKEDPVGVTARAFTSVTLPTIGVYLAQKNLANDKQKQIIDDAPDWLTSTFWLLPVPNTDQVARIPKPFDLAPVFANLPERTLKYIAENDPEAFDGFAKQTLASMSIPTMITGLVPFIEGMANYSFFRQSPIIPQREASLNYPDQYDINTTEVAKFLAKGVNKVTDGQGPLRNFGSPRVMDNTIKGATAGLGTYATSAIDYVAQATGLVDKKLKPAKNTSELPLLRAFLVSDKSGKSLGEVYDEKDKLTRDKGSLKLQSPKAKFPEEKRLKKLNEATGTIGDISKDIRKIENDKNLSPIVKREQINALIEKRNALSRKTIGK